MGQGREDKKGKRILHHTPLHSFCCPVSPPAPLQERGANQIPPTPDAVGMAGWANTIPNVLFSLKLLG